MTWSGDSLPGRTGVGTFLTRAASLGERPFLHFHQDGAWRWLSWAEARRRVLRVAAALVDEGVLPGDRVALISENSAEWILTDFGVQACGAVTVPLYPNLLPRTVRTIVEDSGARVAVAGSRELAAELEGIPSLRRVVLVDPDVRSWFQRTPDGAEEHEVERRLAALDGDDLATIVYTSGTTGESKGVLLAHRNLMGIARSALSAFRVGPDDVLLSVLPYAHVLERLNGVLISSCAGAQVWVSRGLDHLLEDVADVRPTIMIGVPRLFEKVYERVLAQAAAQPLVKRWLFSWASSTGRRAALVSPGGRLLRLEAAAADRLVLAGIRRMLTGGRLRFFMSGGAPLSREVEEFFWGLGVHLLQGWGLTEVASGCVSNTETLHRFGTVGRPMPGVDLRVMPDGEILVRGPGVMLGYHCKPEATAAALEDGWLHTGDIGKLDEDGFLRVTDRKKDLMKTAGGKYVAPLPVESRLEEEPIIEWAVLVGDRRPFVSALIVPEWGALRSIHHVEGDPAALVDDPGVRGLVEERIEGVNRDLAGFERIKAFTLLPSAFSVQSDELTPTLKPKRRVIMGRYETVIAAMYESAARAREAGQGAPAAGRT